MDTQELIARAEASLEGVTPGPWRVCQTSIHGQKYGGCWVEGAGIENDDEFLHSPLIPISGSQGAMSYTTRIVGPQRHDDNDANARFIAASRQLVPDLISALRAERAARERAEVALASTAEREADVCARMVAAAYRDAAEWIESVPETLPNRQEYAAILRKRTPADASAALDRIRQEAADEALERAAQVADEKATVTKDNLYWGMSENELALKGQARHFAAAIRALKGGAK